MSLSLPNEIVWSNQIGESWLIDVFDWDTISLDAHVPRQLSFAMNLCYGFFPCSISIQGKQAGIISLSESGFISCSVKAGCWSVAVSSINFTCSGAINSNPIFKMHGSTLMLHNSHFSDCFSEGDGGVIQSFENSSVTIESCSFQNASSLGFGGAVSAFGGNLSVTKSTFQKCLSRKGGGAIFVAAYQGCYGLSQSINTTVFIESSKFQECSSDNAGGAVLALGDTDAEYEFMVLEISFTEFELCQAALNGGALSIDGDSVIAVVTTSMFLSCYCGSYGGAISSRESSSIALYCSEFKNNSAHGIGGGALFLNDNYLLTYNSSYTSNMAPNGGGGAILWQGHVFPPARLGCPRGMQYHIVSCRTSLQWSDCSWATCAPCEIGFFKSFSGIGNCSYCGAGTYSSVVGSVACASCPAGYYATASGADSSEVCRSCTPGLFSVAGASACSECPAGSFSYQYASTECSSCPAGKYSPEPGANDTEICLPCESGKYSGTSATACSNCMIGTFSNVSDSTSCRRCSDGQYTTRLGANSSEECVSCKPGQYVLSGSSECFICVSGVYSDLAPLHQDLSMISSCAITKLNGSIGRFVPNGQYGNDERIYWLIKSTSINYITLEFTNFSVETEFDFVSIYSCMDENCAGDKHNARFFSGRYVPGPLEFYAIAVLVVSTSDAAVSFSGWSANYRISNVSLQGKRRSHRPRPESYVPANLIRTDANDYQIQSVVRDDSVSSKSTSLTSKFISSPQNFSKLRPLKTKRKHGSSAALAKRHSASGTWSAVEIPGKFSLSTVIFIPLEIVATQRRLVLNRFGNDKYICTDDSNTALYGQCIASDEKKLKFIPSNIPFIFSPGLIFDLIAAKVDAYDQIVLSDSVSHVDVIASGDIDVLGQDPTFVLVGTTSTKLEKGQGILSFSIKPLFDTLDFAGNAVRLRRQPHIRLRGSDSQSHELMQSEIVSMQVRNGSQVCPSGYILLMGTEAAGGWAACTFCSAGSYSLNPLAPAPGSSSGNPACLNCPEGGNCALGGARVSFSFGKWESEAGAYILKGCPSGFQLVNSTDGTSHGIFSHDRQQCKACQRGEYIINPILSECKKCPLGWKVLFQHA